MVQRLAAAALTNKNAGRSPAFLFPTPKSNYSQV
jgi:hypothetical protein